MSERAVRALVALSGEGERDPDLAAGDELAGLAGGGRVPWDCFVRLAEDALARPGGLGSAEGAPFAILLPDVVALAREHVTPWSVCAFLVDIGLPSLFPMVSFELTDRPRSRGAVRARLASGYRGSAAAFRVLEATLSSGPARVGLPRARVETADVGPTGADWVLDLSQPGTALTVLERERGLPAFERALAEIEAEQLELARVLREVRDANRDLEEANEALRAEVALQRELEASLMDALGTAASASFMVRGGAVTPVNGAGEAALDREGDALARAVREAAVGGSSGSFQVTSIAADAALVLRASRGDDIERRLDVARDRWGLTPRHTDVLRGLVRGETNRGIAARIGCAPKTVEVHMSALLDRADAPNRLALVAAFWSDL